MRRPGFDGLLKSPRLLLQWLGWEARADHLQFCGWQFAVAEQNDLRDSIEIAMRHPRAGLMGMARMSGEMAYEARAMMHDPYRFERFAPGDRNRGMLGATVQMMIDCNASRPVLRLMGGVEVPDFAAVDMRTQWVEDREVDAMSIFAPFNTPAPQQIIVDPNEVDSLMRRILELQKPRQAKIRGRQLKEAAHRTHAQIVSLAA